MKSRKPTRWYLRKQFFVGVIAATAIISLGTRASILRQRSKVEDATCFAYLDYIQAVKLSWADIDKRDSNASPNWDNLRPYMENIIWGTTGASNGEKLPQCPKGGIYILGAIKELPQCSVHGTCKGPRAEALAKYGEQHGLAIRTTP